MKKSGLVVLWGLWAWLVLLLLVTAPRDTLGWVLVTVLGAPLLARSVWIAVRPARAEQPKVAPRVR